MVPTQFNENVKCTIHISVNIASNKLLHQEQIIFFLICSCFAIQTKDYCLFCLCQYHPTLMKSCTRRCVQYKQNYSQILMQKS